MTVIRRAPARALAPVVFALGLFYAAGAVTYAAAPIANEVMLVNTQTGKCLTIAGGVSTDNNVTALQFDCDSHPSRTWMIRLKL
jgi:hypothetical protein